MTCNLAFWPLSDHLTDQRPSASQTLPNYTARTPHSLVKNAVTMQAESYDVFHARLSSIGCRPEDGRCHHNRGVGANPTAI